jgi:hypothetical protein
LVGDGRGVLAQRIKAQKPDLPIILAAGFGDMPSSAHPDLIRLNKPFELTTLARATGEGLKPAGWRTVMPVPSRDERWRSRP